MFAAPVDPSFIAAWRDYEERYDRPLAGVWLSLPGLDDGSLPGETKSALDTRWEIADHEAQEQAQAIEDALDFAEEQATDQRRGFPDGFPESIEDGIAEWSRLKEEAGFDLRGAFRRRALVPFVLVPRHVSQHHGATEKLSLLTNLQQAHDAFIFGIPFAALALMRSTLEVTLKNHYRPEGEDLAAQIDNCASLPRGASKEALHRLRRLANDVLHVNKDQVRLPKDTEKELLSLLFVLRALIEGAPA